MRLRSVEFTGNMDSVIFDVVGDITAVLFIRNEYKD